MEHAEVSPTVSVIVPACNEEAVISRCLGALLAEAQPGQLDVIVVCNGCTDATADVARSFGGWVRVIETPIGSKPHALNLGDSAARTHPRVFVDADVELPTADLLALAEPLRSGRAEAAAPRLRVDTSGASLGVRAYHAVWTRLPQIRHGLMGRGVYALSQTGRARFEAFLDVVADDLYLDQLFPADRRAVAEAVSTIHPPRSLGELVHRKSRVFFGARELERLGLMQTSRPRGRALWHTLRSDLWLLPAVPIYVSVNVLAKRRARRELKRRGRTDWHRDSGSRR